MDSLTVVALTGILERDPVVRFAPDSSALKCRATLRLEEVNPTTGAVWMTKADGAKHQVKAWKPRLATGVTGNQPDVTGTGNEKIPNKNNGVTGVTGVTCIHNNSENMRENTSIEVLQDFNGKWGNTGSIGNKPLCLHNYITTENGVLCTLCNAFVPGRPVLPDPEER